MLVIPGVDTYLGELQEQFERGSLGLDVYKYVTVRTSKQNVGGEQLALPDADKDDTPAVPSAKQSEKGNPP